MRKLDLRDYQVTRKVIGGDGKLIDIAELYPVKDSILNIMFQPSLGLQGAEAVRQQVLAHKIEQAKDEIMLEEEEYERVKKAIESFSVQTRYDVELIDRVLNKTKDIEITEKT